MSYLYEKYDYSLFRSRFEDYGRHIQFSEAGLRALYEALLQYVEDTMEPLEVDVIALCCDYNEIDISECESETGHDLDSLKDETYVIEVDSDTIIYQTF